MIYKIILIALLFTLSVARSDALLIFLIGLTTIISLVSNVKLKFKFLEVILLLTSIFVLALISSFFEQPTLYNAVKDTWYLLKPVLVLYSAYFVTSKIDDKEFFFRAVIYIGVLAAAIHLVKVIPELVGDAQKISLIRYKSGKGNIVEIFSLAFLYLNKENKYFKTKNLKYGLYALLLSSIIFYFSRTMLLLLFMVIFSMKGYFKLTSRSIKYLSFLLITGFLAFSYLNSMDLNADQTGFKGFLYKIKIAPSELTKTDINVNDHRDLWDHFRAYEASKAIETAGENGLRAVIFGSGLGALVNLDLEVNLAQEDVQFIPIIHNGFVFVFFKAGILGLLAYLLMILILYLKVYNVNRNRNRNYLIICRFISTIGIYYMFTSLVITGIYNPSDIMAVFLGGALFLEPYFKNPPQLVLS